MIDITFDYRTDCDYPKQDPDKYSCRLKKDHCEMWSKPLPVSKYGELKPQPKKERLVAFINGEHFDFGCDSITNCYTNRDNTFELRKDKEIVDLINKYNDVDYTIASSIIFPLQRDDGVTKWTINQARGCLRRISDRIDLTLECIRIFYLDNYQKTPLQSCLIKYKRFFDWFGSFENYVKFFLLDDLVSKDYKTVIGFTDVLDFDHAMPISSVEEYKEYIKRNISFIEKRTERIEKELALRSQRRSI